MPSVRRPSRSNRKCLRPGPVGRNPYLNFLREFRKKCCGLSAVKTIQQGAKVWNQLTPSERRLYVEEAFYAPLRRRKSVMKRKESRMSGKRSRRRTGSRSMQRSASSRSRSGAKRASRSHSRARAGIICNL